MALRRKFIDIELPLLDMTERVLGTPEYLEGRNLSIDMTRKMRGKGLEIVFKIFSYEGKLFGLPKKMHLMKFYIKRVMRKRISYVEDTIKTECRDGRIVIKPFLITRKKVSRAVRNNLRSTAKKLILDFVSDKTYEEIADSILKGDLQKEIHPKLKKIYPLSFCDIRVFETPDIQGLIENYKNKPVNEKEADMENQEKDIGNEEGTKEEEADQDEKKTKKTKKKVKKTTKKTAKKGVKKASKKKDE